MVEYSSFIRTDCTVFPKKHYTAFRTTTLNYGGFDGTEASVIAAGFSSSDVCGPGHMCAATFASSESTSLCFECMKGMYCEYGTVNKERTSTANLCPAGSYCPDPTAILPCPVGHQCPAGSFKSQLQQLGG
jgi:hypothetical protein